VSWATAFVEHSNKSLVYIGSIVQGSMFVKLILLLLIDIWMDHCEVCVSIVFACFRLEQK